MSAIVADASIGALLTGTGLIAAAVWAAIIVVRSEFDRRPIEQRRQAELDAERKFAYDRMRDRGDLPSTATHEE
jgi:hypothetical protein